MFRRLFDFGYQRTALQAFGWYLFFLLIAGLLGGLAGATAAQFGFISAGDFKANLLIGERLAPLVPVVVGGVLFFAKPITPTSVIVTLIAFIVSFLAGWLGAGILLAFLTTRPSRGPGTVPSVFD